MAAAAVPGDYDGVYALDVLEHIRPGVDETKFLDNCVASLAKKGGIAVFGSPSLESQKYASPISIAGHVNCYSGQDLKARLSQWFRVVLIFSMNDEMVHTGFDKMANYLLAVCCDRLD